MRKLFSILCICLFGISMIGCVVATDASCDNHKGAISIEKKICDDHENVDDTIFIKPSNDNLIDVDPTDPHVYEGGFSKTII